MVCLASRISIERTACFSFLELGVENAGLDSDGVV
jgi:hypothetical protein